MLWRGLELVMIFCSLPPVFPYSSFMEVDLCAIGQPGSADGKL
jgi:hypothetical protein